MEKTSTKTIVCGVLFLDIVEYSRMSVAEQISIKERFNNYLAAAISSVPNEDRIVLDTSDGAAINFMGNIANALGIAIDLRNSVCNESADIYPSLQLRMGLNLGPVRLVMDINGQPNVVGDGVNVAQRIMGFAEPGQILASRAFCDTVSQLSPQYAGLFHFLGSHTDKHVREHEVYEVGKPDEVSAELLATSQLDNIETGKTTTRGAVDAPEKKRQLLYIGAATVSVLLVGILLFKGNSTEKPPETVPAITMVPVAPVATTAPVAEAAKIDADRTVSQPMHAQTMSGAKILAEPKTAAPKADMKPDGAAKTSKISESKTKPVESGSKASLDKESQQNTATYVVVVCKNDEAKVFVDSDYKGKVSHGSLTVRVSPGKHEILARHESGFLHKQKIDLVQGESRNIAPKFCD